MLKNLIKFALVFVFIPSLCLAGPPGKMLIKEGTSNDNYPTFNPSDKSAAFPGSVAIGATKGSDTLTGYELSAPAYGVRWNATDDTHSAGVLVNGYFTPSTITHFPIQRQMKGVLLGDDGTENYLLCAINWSTKADCSTASTLTGADGQVMVRIPAFYVGQYQFSDANLSKTYV